MQPQSDTSGSYIAIAGIIALILTKFGVNADSQSIMTVITGAVTLFGIIRQLLAHKKLAIQAGVVK